MENTDPPRQKTGTKNVAVKPVVIDLVGSDNESEVDVEQLSTKVGKKVARKRMDDSTIFDETNRTKSNSAKATQDLAIIVAEAKFKKRKTTMMLLGCLKNGFRYFQKS